MKIPAQVEYRTTHNWCVLESKELPFYCWWPTAIERERKQKKGNYSSTSWREISETRSLFPLSSSHSVLLSHCAISITYSFNNSSLRDTHTQTVIRRFRKGAAGTGQENICYYHTHTLTAQTSLTHSAFITQHPFQLSWNISKLGHTNTPFALSSLSTRGGGTRFNQPGPRVSPSKMSKCLMVVL